MGNGSIAGAYLMKILVAVDGDKRNVTREIDGGPHTVDRDE